MDSPRALVLKALRRKRQGSKFTITFASLHPSGALSASLVNKKTSALSVLQFLPSDYQ